MVLRLVVVTGMHRAGTSLVARILGLAGASLGPDDMMMSPTPDNPRGYWELQAVADLDTELLERLGGRWHRLPGLTESWQFDRDLDPLRRAADDILGRAFAGLHETDVAAMKDPRLSVVQPFWRTVTDLHATITPIRAPHQVVGSLSKRDQMSPVKAAALWTDHVTAAIANDPTTLVVDYDALLSDPVGQATRMAAHVGLPPPGAAESATIERFRDRRLQRNADFDAGRSRELAAATALYESLVQDDDTTGRQRAAAMATQLWHDRNESRLQADRLRAAEGELDVGRRELAQRDRDLSQSAGELRAMTRRAEELAPYPDRARKAESELGRRTNELRHARRAAQRWEDEYERLVQRKAVKAALSTAQVFKPAIRKVRELRGQDPTGGRESAGAGGALRSVQHDQASRRAEAPKHVPATQEAAEKLRQKLLAQLPPRRPVGPGAPHVTIAILTRDGLHHLRTCIPAVLATDYPHLDVVVIDNASSDGSVAWLNEQLDDAGPTITIVRNEQNATFSVGNNQAIAATAQGRSPDDLVLLLNNDIEPIDPGWLARLVQTQQDHGAAAVGTRLVYPRRPGLDNSGDLTFADLSLQHGGIAFDAPFDGVPRGRNLGAGQDPLAEDATRVGPVAAATAACLLLRRGHLEEVGGLTEDYVYGTEDVELCLKVRAAGGEIVYDGKVALWHHEYGTQNSAGRDAKRRNRLHNREVFVDTWGPRIFREVFLDKLRGAGLPPTDDAPSTPREPGALWSPVPLHVAITVTKDDESAGYGDWYTAHQFGDALESLGWEVSYAERYGDRWYDLDPSVDVLVAMIDAIDLTRVPDHVVTCAWVRNWPQRWTGHDWLDDYDIVFASSRALADEIERHSIHTCVPLALAADPDLFSPGAAGDHGDREGDVDVLFVGSRHDKPRAIEEALAPMSMKVRVGLHGHGWDASPTAAGLTRGPISYRDLPAAYGRTPIVVDDTVGEATKRFDAVNSRVFEAIAAGALVITDNPRGCAELFDTPVPAWSTPQDLVRSVERWLGDDEERLRVATALRDELLAKHTYRHRAEAFAVALRRWAATTRVTVLAGVPRREEAPAWGDHHYGRALQRALGRIGVPSRLALLPEWPSPSVARSDVVVHLYGLSEHRPRVGQVNVLWNISHPEKVTLDLVEQYDLACVASTSFARDLASRTTTPVVPLLQATDTDRMRPDASGPRHDLLFVANSRKVRRQIVDDAIRAGLDDHLAVYGRDWTPDLVPQACVFGQHVDNRDLPAWYGSAQIVLNDHWEGMRDHGFLSNRLFDALACGAFVISDRVVGIDEVFDGTIVTYEGPDDLRAKVMQWLGDEEGRRELAERGRRLVLEKHSFDARARELWAHVLPLVAQRPSRVTG